MMKETYIILLVVGLLMPILVMGDVIGVSTGLMLSAPPYQTPSPTLWDLISIIVIVVTIVLVIWGGQDMMRAFHVDGDE